jgi:ABC-type sugar transport system substrate-binding protein
MNTQPARRHKAMRLTALASAACIVAVTAACSSDKSEGSTPNSSASAGAKKFTIGVGECDTSIPFLAVLDKAIEDEAKRLGHEAVVLNGKLDNALQAANIDTLVTKKVDGILVISCSPTAVVPAIKRARAAGIPVFSVNAKLDAAAEVITYIGASDFDMGVGQGELLVKALPNGGKVAVILGPLGDTPQVQRLAGLKKVLENHPNIEIVATPTDGFDNAKNLAATQDLLTKYPAGQLDAIVAQGPQMYVGAEYARKQGRTELVFIAADYNKKVEAAIKSGAIYGTIDQSPVLEGQLGAKYMIDWLNGNEAAVPKPEFLIETPAITKDNVEATPATWN